MSSGPPSSRAASQTNVYLDAFGYRDNQAFDTMSVDSTDSIETSISACSPDNVSRYLQSKVTSKSRTERRKVTVLQVTAESLEDTQTCFCVHNEPLRVGRGCGEEQREQKVS